MANENQFETTVVDLSHVPDLDILREANRRVKNYSQILYSQLANAIVQLADVKADKVDPFVLVIPKSGWAEELNENDEPVYEEFPYYCDVTISGITDVDIVDITFLLSSQKKATACGFCPLTETLGGVNKGKVRFRSLEIPADDLSARCIVQKAYIEEEGV